MSSFIRVVEKEGSEQVMELPVENNGTMLLTTIQAQFPRAIGLKYKSESGAWRGVRAAGDALDPPLDGWGQIDYVVTESSELNNCYLCQICLMKR